MEWGKCCFAFFACGLALVFLGVHSRCASLRPSVCTWVHLCGRKAVGDVRIDGWIGGLVVGGREGGGEGEGGRDSLAARRETSSELSVAQALLELLALCASRSRALDSIRGTVRCPGKISIPDTLSTCIELSYVRVAEYVLVCSRRLSSPLQVIQPAHSLTGQSRLPPCRPACRAGRVQQRTVLSRRVALERCLAS